MRLAVRAGTFYDGTSTPPQTNVTLILDGGRIEALGGEDATVERTLWAACVVPGLINSHAHLELSGVPDSQTFFLIRTDAGTDARRGAQRAALARSGRDDHPRSGRHQLQCDRPA